MRLRPKATHVGECLQSMQPYARSCGAHEHKLDMGERLCGVNQERNIDPFKECTQESYNGLLRMLTQHVTRHTYGGEGKPVSFHPLGIKKTRSVATRETMSRCSVALTVVIIVLVDSNVASHARKRS